MERDPYHAITALIVSSIRKKIIVFKQFTETAYHSILGQEFLDNNSSVITRLPQTFTITSSHLSSDTKYPNSPGKEYRCWIYVTYFFPLPKKLLTLASRANTQTYL